MGTLHKCLEEGRYGQFVFLAKHYPGAANARDRRGRTPLHLCCRLTSDLWAVNCAKLLLNLSAEAGPTDDEGRTPLHYACENGKLAVARTLLQLVPDICVDSSDHDGNTPLHCAIANGSQSLIRLLLTYYRKYELDIDRKNRVGFTPLQLAAANGLLDIARLLIVGAGASTTQRDDVFFKSAYEWLEAYYGERSPATNTRAFDFDDGLRRRNEDIQTTIAQWKANREEHYDFSRLRLHGAGPLFLAYDAAQERSSNGGGFSRKEQRFPSRARLPPAARSCASTGDSRGGGDLSSVESSRFVSAPSTGGNSPPTSWSMLTDATEVLLQQLSASYRRSTPSHASQLVFPKDEDPAVQSAAKR